VVIVVNMVLFGVYAACLRLQPNMHWLSFVFVIASVTAVSTMPFVAWEYQSGYRPSLDPVTVAAALYVAIFPGFLCVAAWNRATELIGSNRAGPFMHLIPLYSAILASLFLGERIGVFHVAGLGLILIGVWLASGKARATAPDAASS